MTTILDCGHPPSPTPSNYMTGYGTAAGKRYCYACCAAQERQSMIDTGRATLYLSKEQVGTHSYVYWASDWPGELRFRAVVKHGRHNIARTRIDAWFVGPDGYRWHGVQLGEWNEILRCRRTKERAA